MKGIIALDIDGTITSNHQDLDPEVSKFLKYLCVEGWILVFITGRTFLWGYEVLKHLDFIYYLAVHNGVTICEMPSGNIIFRKLLNSKCLSLIDEVFFHKKTDYIIYAESSYGPVCYYRPEYQTPELLKYFSERSAHFKENWVALQSYEDLPIKDFSALKFFASEKEAKMISSELDRLNLHAPMIRDPFDSDYYVIQATHREVSKGHALKQLKQILGAQQKISIAAGDDNNDASMLDVADIKVVMATAPENLLQGAHIIAPPADKKGIIVGLKKAIEIADKIDR